MLVECITGDFSDPEAVSGSSTTFEVKIAYLGIFSCIARLETRSQEENTHLDNFILQTKNVAGGKKEKRGGLSFLRKSEGSATASKAEPSIVECGVYILDQMFVFGFCISFVCKSYFYNKLLKC